MFSQNDNYNSSATTKSAIDTNTANQTRAVASIDRNATVPSGPLLKSPDVLNLLSQQTDVMNAA